MTTKIQGQRAGPPPGSWHTLNEGAPVEIAGLRSRLREAQLFVEEAIAAGAGRAGVVARYEHEDPHGRHRTTVAIDGWWMSQGLLGGQRRHVSQVGYLPEWAVRECLRDGSPDPAVFVELDGALREDGYLDIDVMVHVKRSLAAPIEGSEERMARHARLLCMPGLKILTRVAMAKGNTDEIAMFAMMVDYVAARTSRSGLHIGLDVAGQIVEAAAGLAPTDQAILAATRLIAEDDDSLDELFRFSLELARADGQESEAAIGVLKRVLEAARQTREKHPPGSPA